jgi:cyclic pyranopterin phosphate synthase
MGELSHLDEAGRVRRVDVGEKQPTRRTAVALAVLHAGRQVMEVVRSGETPKGNVFAAAHLAGVMAAKRTSELIPLCHPLPLDGVNIEFEQGEERIRITATASTHARTGVEMEALTAAAVAALTVYDMLKAVSHDMVIEEVRLLKKTGGKSDIRHADTMEGGSVEEANATSLRKGARKDSRTSGPDAGQLTQCPAHVNQQDDSACAGTQAGPIRAAVITVSDRCFAGLAQDTSGPAVIELIQRELGAAVSWSGIIPDESEQISAKIVELAAREVDLIVTVGGTGCGPRDVTPEATRAVITREAPGLAEAMRAASAQVTDKALLQRGVCGIRESSLIINLPGSPRGAVENLSVILPTIAHAVALLRGQSAH